MNSLIAFVIAAVCEIAGCFAVWSYFRLARPVWVLAPGLALLLLFAYALTRVDAASAGRAYAAYGGVGLITLAVTHTSNHYGQVVEYRRMNGLAPPRTQ